MGGQHLRVQMCTHVRFCFNVVTPLVLLEDIHLTFKLIVRVIIFSAISWWEQVNYQWDDDEVRLVQNQHAELEQ